ncbi:FIST signal transduction protein [Sulfurospirillum oryzae]|uniref:FIST signal transduction protein n=1 Tax=Sulfurospirillum oryzae TaxID=2976535 RepID=UPI0021E6F832|nr:FIST C-terminal domain-containing protein [Sulfurospirillum oryzae]
MFERISFFKRIEDLNKKLEKGSYLLLIAEETPFLDIPKHQDVSMCGAIFPRVIFKGKTYEKGIVAAKLSPTTSMQIVDMDTPRQFIPSPDTNSIFTIVDAFSTQIDDFLEEFYSQLPAKAKLIGGGAGTSNLIQEPIMFDMYRFYMNSAIIITSTSSIGIGVKHGWKSLVGPFIATNCHENVVEKINFKDAFSIYKEAIEKDSDLRFENTPFFKISQRYPLGIVRYNRDFIVREPVTTDGKNIVLVGKLDSNSVLSILKGEKEDLIKAAQEAAYISRDGIEEERISSVLLVDCISRFCFLDNEFKQEVKAIAKPYPKETMIWGMLSLGEIANANQEGIEFYNNTCVVGTL